MKSIVEEIFYGNLRPEERIVPRDPDYRPLNRVFCIIPFQRRSDSIFTVVKG
ncbi:DUF6809 family protein [Paenibacillus sp. MB22_1]|uniref:DUF6809 family protein n=1 Tax=Paenibacillus sp. MB22_1 TaxID=3383121 RepID=UPI0039A04A97